MTGQERILHLFVDGASRGNPGPASVGAHIVLPGGTVHEACAYIGKATNNQAEYLALLLGLATILQHHSASSVQHIKVTADSELLVKQMNNIYRIKDETLMRLRLAIDTLIVHLNRPITFHHVLRQHNSKADALANKALDKKIAPPAHFTSWLHTMQLSLPLHTT